MRIIEVEITKIRPDPKQPRQYIDEEKITEMAKSIITEGVINPVEVDKQGMIVTGELRWRAAIKAGLKTVPCKIIDPKAETRFRRQVIENVHHNTMTDWDTATALNKLLASSRAELARDKFHEGERYSKGIKELSEMVGKSKTFIVDHLDILKASPRFKKAVKAQKISYSHYPAIRSAPKEFQDELEKKVLREKYANRDITRLIARGLRDYPNYAPQIFRTSFSKLGVNKTEQKLKKLIPGFTTRPITDLIKAGEEPVKELHQAIDIILKLLREKAPKDFGRIHLPNIIMSLDLLHNTIREWLLEVKRPQLGEGH